MKSLTIAVLLFALTATLPRPAAAQTVLSLRTLVRTTLITSSSKDTVGGVFCTTTGCSGPPAMGFGFVFLKSWKVTCPQPAGATCTFVITGWGTFQISDGDEGFIYGWVNGGTPVTANSFAEAGPLMLPTSGAASESSVFTVKNTVANQTWPTAFTFGCVDVSGDGNCSIETPWLLDGQGLGGGQGGSSSQGTVKIEVYTP